MSFCTDRSTWSFAFETSTLNFLIALPPTRRFHPHLISIFLFPFLPPSVKRYQRFLSRSRSHRLQSYVPQLLSPPENWFIDSLACTRTHGNIGYHVNPEQRLHTVSVPLTNARFRENWLRLSFHLNLRKIFFGGTPPMSASVSRSPTIFVCSCQFRNHVGDRKALWGIQTHDHAKQERNHDTRFYHTMFVHPSITSYARSEFICRRYIITIPAYWAVIWPPIVRGNPSIGHARSAADTRNGEGTANSFRCPVQSA